MNDLALTPGQRALDRAKEADRQLWATTTGSAAHRRARALAVVAALNAGISPEEVAEALKVRVSDVTRMAADAAE